MSWNGSENKIAAPAPKNTAKTPPSKWRGVAALVAVVAAGGLAAWWFMRSSGRDALVASDMAKPSQIAEVKPQIPTNKVGEAEASKPVKPAVVTNFNEKGVWYDPEGRPHYKPARVIHMGSNTVINGKRWEPPRRLFKRSSECELDRVLSARPGERIFGETNWRAFEKDLREAMVEPIRIDPEDTPEEVERKEAVKAAKKELAVAIGNGEDPSEILREAQRDLNKLADLYDGLNRELYELRTSGEASEQDIEDYVNAANKMLESKNIFTKKFHTPAEMQAKREAARQRKLEKQQEKR